MECMNTTRKEKTSQLRVAVTPYCNLRCPYCRPGGEGYYENLNEIMRQEEIVTIIQLAAKIGFTHVKFTGGEPLLREDIFDIIMKTRTIPGIKEIQLVTNGTLLRSKTTKKLKESGIDLLTISLDAVDPILFKKIRGVDASVILGNIYEVKNIGLLTRINMVVMKSNLSQIEPMINLCEKIGASLKLLDLIYIEGYSNFDFWRKEFIHFNAVRNLLYSKGARYIGIEEAPGGIGAPLDKYKMPNGVEVVLKDSTKGTYYHESCKECKFYPCQDAVISVRITHDGKIKRCLIRNDNLVPLLPLLRKGAMEECAISLGKVFKLMTESMYYPHMWSPEILIKQKKGGSYRV